MRFAICPRILLLLALPVVGASCALAQDHPEVEQVALLDQSTVKVPAPAQTKPAAQKAPMAKIPAQSKGQGRAKAATPTAPPKQESQKPGNPAAAAPQKVSVARRDPFETLLNKATASNAPPENLPPGKAGLVVGTLRIEGIVHDAMGMIAVVSNPQQRVYFLREGDKLYDGSVDHITLEAISFHEIGKDAFGKPLERQVTKRLFPSPGE